MYVACHSLLLNDLSEVQHTFVVDLRLHGNEQLPTLPGYHAHDAYGTVYGTTRLACKRHIDRPKCAKCIK